MKKTVAIMTISEQVGMFYTQQLYGLFGDIISVKNYSVEENGFENMINADLYLVGATSSDIFEYALSCIPQTSQVVLSNLTFTKHSIEMLKKLPQGTKALLVNLSSNMAMETVSDLYKLGINNIEFTPVGPDAVSVPHLKIAVTPAEARFVPSFVEQTVDIGHRVFSSGVIAEMAFKLGIPDFLSTEKCKAYNAALAEREYGLETLNSRAWNLEGRFEILLNAIDIGVVGIDNDNIIFAFNNAAERVLGEKRQNVLGKTTDMALSCLPINIFTDNMAKADIKLINVKNNPVSLSIVPIIQGDRFLGYFAIVQRFNDEEEKQRKLRLQMLNRGHVAKYTFDDIIGTCPQILQAKSVAQKMAASNASVLIYGESGTGKELFAHAIHNYSQRASMPFVAINCAALPESLLESELFGYAEGSFTGAKKGGKLGLFEHAHNGTLFLDEIEGMSHTLQIKLLRVLQEKEIIRVGDDRIVNVDVRIIAASNENIKEMVNKGSFRKDLYYRLNALPLEIPPLRCRQGDVMVLANHLIEEIGADFVISAEAQRAFNEYKWDGNIRELRNIIEYLNYVGKDVIEYDDLPEVFHNKEYDVYIEKQNDIMLDEFNFMAGKKEQQYSFVLNCLYIANRENKNAGREKISKLACQKGLVITQQEIRTIFSNCERYGLVDILKGRNGTKITEKGIKLVENINKMVTN